MSVKIRLARRGRKKQAMYDVVVADARAPRDGRFIEKLGTYNPNTDPASINLDNDKAFDWVMKGAQPTDTVRAMLSYRGIMMKKHLQIGVNKGAITQEEADKKLEAWMKDKESKIQGKVETLAKAKADKKKAALEAEKKVSDARAEELKKRAQEAEAALVEEIKEGGAEENEDVADDVAEVEEAQATETKAEEPKAEAKEEPKAEEAKEEPKAEAKEEVKAEEAKEEPKAEAKEEAPAEEAKEDKKEG
ncbi:SSU ribosomal protein S16P [Ekhidna lutea]|uniref:Small ribosomal subunit protein bS16 n=1 Tax=Ekhidna lutea TaxID=447679 RepID=A0A239KQ70_EKHLU|nr:30S ribosomal protein S16 [Ekhidna lutea]SNT19334.1 SSU ribosomal protein S16P [Ekhidna lutea]